MNTDNKPGWLESTKSFFSGVAKEVSSLVVPLPDQSAQKSAANIQSPLGGNSYQQQQQQQQGGYGQPSPYGQPAPQAYGQQPYAPQGGYPTAAPYGADSSAGWSDGSDGMGAMPVVPLAQQYSNSRPGSRRTSLDPNVAAGLAGAQTPNLNPNLGAFPTSAFPSSPPSALAQQLQPLGAPQYAPQPGQPQQQQQLQQGQAFGQQRYTVDELQSVTAVSASPSPSPPPVHSGGFHAGYNPALMSAAAYPPPPTQHLAPVLPNSQQPMAPPAYSGSSMQPPQPFHPAAAPPARRVLDEHSINPAFSGPQPNPAYGGVPSPQQQPAPLQTHSGYHQTTLVSPGRVLSPEFNSGGQTVPSGNMMSRPQQPQMPAQQPMQQQQQQHQQHPPAPLSPAHPSPAYSNGLGMGMGSSSGMPPPPPVSNYWKQRAAVAPTHAAVADPTVGRVDYSDLDYKSMDFAYNNRYERAQQMDQMQGQQGQQQQQPQQQQQHPAYPPPSQQQAQQPYQPNYNQHPYSR